MPIDQAVGEVAEALLGACQRRNAQEVMSALDGPVLTAADAQFPGLGNLHLAFAFARILSRECPTDARDGDGVPRISALVGDGAETATFADAHIAVGMELGQPSSRADAKGSNARFAAGIPLTQRFMRIWTLSPQAVPAFVETQSARSPIMVDDVWGVLFQACASVRSVGNGPILSTYA